MFAFCLHLSELEKPRAGWREGRTLEKDDLSSAHQDKTHKYNDTYTDHTNVVAQIQIHRWTLTQTEIRIRIHKYVQMHKYTTQNVKTQIKKNTNTQIKKYTNTQKIHNYAYKKTKKVIGKTTCWLEGRSNCGGDGWFIMSSPPSCWQYSANNCSHVYVCGCALTPNSPNGNSFVKN